MSDSTKIAGKRRKRKLQHQLTIGLIVLAALLCFMLVFHLFREANSSRNLPRSRFPYVDGATATEQVSNFYRQYLGSRNQHERDITVGGFGNPSLSFYSLYYRHGFDPITCSLAVPKFVTTHLTHTGFTAVVAITPQFESGPGESFTAEVVLNDGMRIDSITCPGALGRLEPGILVNPAFGQ